MTLEVKTENLDRVVSGKNYSGRRITLIAEYRDFDEASVKEWEKAVTELFNEISLENLEFMPEVEEPEPEPEPEPETEEADETDEEEEDEYYCSECEHNHRKSSKVGQDHLEYAEEDE